MKKLITLLFMTSLSCALVAQQDKANDLVQIAKQGLKETKEVSFQASPAALQVDHYLIPISQDTHVKLRNEKKNYSVVFSLQNETAVTSTNDAQWRRASFELAFKSKNDAKNFVRVFEEVAGKN